MYEHEIYEDTVVYHQYTMRLMNIHDSVREMASVPCDIIYVDL